MPRRREIPKRHILPDPKYQSDIVAKFVNVLMERGKKSVAEKIVYEALGFLVGQAKKIKSTDEASEKPYSVLQYFEKALDNVRPHLEVRARRVGGATYQVPVEVRHDRSMALAMRWIIQSARLRSEQGMIKRLANELIDAFDSKGAAVKKRETMHQMAKANQAFAHFKFN